jgi:uncharacterized protein (TIGR02145 family)
MNSFIIKISKIMKQKILLSIFIFLMAAGGYAQSATITVNSVQQRTDQTGLVDIYYDLTGGSFSYYISVEASMDGGVVYIPIPRPSLSGAVSHVFPGNNHHVVWDGLSSFPNTYSEQAKIKIVAIESSDYGGEHCPGLPTVTDIDGNVYNTVQIGDQCWMKENLKTITYRNGTPIGYGNYFWYDDDVSWKNLYGGLYTWNVATSTNGLCPDGWTVPSNEHWSQLISFVDGGSATGGNRVKSCRQIDSPLGGDCSTILQPRWEADISNYGTDDYGFASLPGGRKSYNSYTFSGISTNGYWWSTTVLPTPFFYYLGLSNNSSGFSIVQLYGSGSYNQVFNNGMSIRCIKVE